MIQIIKDYINTKIKILRLEIYEKSSKITARLLNVFILSMFAFLFIVFGSICLALYIGRNTGDILTGFLWVSGIYFFLFLFLLIFRKPLLERPIINSLIKKLSKKYVEEESDKQPE